MATKLRLTFREDADPVEKSQIKFRESGFTSPGDPVDNPESYLNYSANTDDNDHTNIVVEDVFAGGTPVTDVKGRVIRSSLDSGGTNDYLDTALWTCTACTGGENDGVQKIGEGRYMKATVGDINVKNTDGANLETEVYYFGKTNIPASWDIDPDSGSITGSPSSAIDYYLYVDTGVLKVTTSFATAIANSGVIVNPTANDSAGVQSYVVTLGANEDATTFNADIVCNNGGTPISKNGIIIPDGDTYDGADMFIKITTEALIYDTLNLALFVGIKDDYPVVSEITKVINFGWTGASSGGGGTT